MSTPQLSESIEYAAVRGNVRVYVVFTSQHIPLWTRLVRWGIKRYQGYPVTWTHALLLVQDMTTSVMYFYEMAVWNGMDLYTVDYDSVRYNSETKELIVAQEIWNGLVTEEEYHAIDVTPIINTDVDYNWYSSLTEVRLTPWTLMRHLSRRFTDKKTWTCSGLVQALLGMPRYLAYVNPMSPDMLHRYLTIVLNNSTV
jgi:hypothetical protein